MRQPRGWLLAVGMLVPVAAAAQGGRGGAPRLLPVDDLFALKEVGEPQISPDGRWVAYMVTTTDLKAEKSESRLWMAPLAGGEGGAVPLTVPGSSASAPRWSPDGRYVSFLAARKTGAPGDSEPKTQVWALDRRGGEARPLTHVPQGDRKSTRLNSSHLVISYAVFCLKKKIKQK